MREICSVPVCEREVAAGKYCGAHYQRSLRGGDMTGAIKGPYTPKPNCSMPGCFRATRTLGLCAFHYVRKWSGKSLDDPIRVTARRNTRSLRDTDGRKRCCDCKQWLPVENFGSQPRSGDGLRARCRACTRIWRLNDAYGITPGQVDALFDGQGRSCLICDTKDAKWVIDHDHACCPGERRTCGQCIRGILCDPCNTGLGRFSDSIETLQAAIRYLEKSR